MERRLLAAIVAATAPVLLWPSALVLAATSIGAVSPGSATAGEATTFTANVSDPQGIQSCNLYVDNDDKGKMTVSGGQASKTHTLPNAQIYTLFIFCRNDVGGFNSGPNTSVWAQAGAGGGDTTAPSVGAVAPLTATAGQAITFTATVSDSGTGVQSCHLVVGGQDKGAMTLAGGVASLAYTFSASGDVAVYASCEDGAGNTGNGSSALVGVATAVNLAPAPTPTPAPAPQPPASVMPGTLVKLECPVEAASDHPCKAVYYYATDGKRHAFPNEKIYFSWYSDFSGVATVSAETLASLQLGKNVTYRPGVRMIKFITSNKIYAVSKGGKLRWVTSEQAASAIYGTDWNKKVDDVPDAFFFDYSYGVDITMATDFDPAVETSAIQNIGLNL